MGQLARNTETHKQIYAGTMWLWHFLPDKYTGFGRKIGQKYITSMYEWLEKLFLNFGQVQFTFNWQRFDMGYT